MQKRPVVGDFGGRMTERRILGCPAPSTRSLVWEPDLTHPPQTTKSVQNESGLNANMINIVAYQR